MTLVDPETWQGVLSDAQLSALCGSLGERYAQIHGARPQAPAALFDDDVLEFRFFDGLSEPERQLRERGEFGALQIGRERGLVVTGAQLALPVERMTHSEVGFHLGLFSPEQTETKFLFGFERALEPEPDDRAELLNWSAEMRRRARELRAEGRDIRESSEELRAHFREQRQQRAREYEALRAARERREEGGADRPRSDDD